MYIINLNWENKLDFLTRNPQSFSLHLHDFEKKNNRDKVTCINAHTQSHLQDWGYYTLHSLVISSSSDFIAFYYGRRKAH